MDIIRPIIEMNIIISVPSSPVSVAAVYDNVESNASRILSSSLLKIPPINIVIKPPNKPLNAPCIKYPLSSSRTISIVTNPPIRGPIKNSGAHNKPKTIVKTAVTILPKIVADQSTII